MSSDSGDAKCVVETIGSQKILDGLRARSVSSLALCQRIEKKAIAICGYQVPAERPNNEIEKSPATPGFSANSFRLLQEIDDNLVRANAAIKAMDKFI